MALRILVIEDNAANLELMRYLLAAAGHEVCTAGNGRDGLALADARTPDLVLCDLQMPVMDGYEVARHMKATDDLRRIPLVAVTASAMPSDLERVDAAGFDACLTKPLEPEDFVRVVEALHARGCGARE